MQNVFLKKKKYSLFGCEHIKKLEIIKIKLANSGFLIERTS
jgi:hypothetical protein